MTLNELQSRIEMIQAGSNAVCIWSRPMSTYKKYDHLDIRVTKQCVVRFGINYDNKKRTIEGRANGTLPKKNAGLRGMYWYQFPYILVSKHDSEQYYLRLNSGSIVREPVEVISLNGKIVSRESIQHYLLKSEMPKEKHTFNIKLQNLVSL